MRFLCLLLLLSVLYLSQSIAVATESEYDEQHPLIDMSEARDNVDFRWVPYCEILSNRNALGLRHFTDLTAYNTLLDGCDPEWWKGVTPALMRSIDGSLFTRLNGPRGWAFDTVSLNSTLVNQTTTEINGRHLVVVGIVELTWQELIRGLLGGTNFYHPRTVQRRTIYIFKRGKSISFLQSPTGEVYVMQSYSQQFFPVSAQNLPVLGAHLARLPAGWTYNHVEKLQLDLPLKAQNDIGVIVNDEMMNTYSQCDAALLRRAVGKGNRIVSMTPSSTTHLDL